MTPFTASDFSGGITDNYLSCPVNCYAQADNFSIDINGKLHTRLGTIAYSTRVPSTPTNSRVSGIYLGNDPFGAPFVFRGASVYYAASSSWTEVLGPANNFACPNKGANDVEKALIWRRQLIYACGNSTNDVLPHRIYCTTLGSAYTAVTLGLPIPAGVGSITAANGGHSGSNTYVYQFIFRYPFTDYQSTAFEEKSAIWLPAGLTLASVTAPSSNNVTISNIPVLGNTSSTNYDVGNIQIDIFRTISNGKSFYLVGSITNGTTSYVDSTTDAALLVAQEIYTDGGVLSYYPPPVGAKYTTVVNDFFWYATDSILTQSILGGAGECPLEYYQPFAQKIQGLSDILSFPILFCDRSVYRIDGVFDELGGGGFTPYEISQTAGCISNRSIVKIPGGLVWAGNGGFYFTDGYQVQKITMNLDVRYQSWKSQFISGCYDSAKNQVIWSISSAANSNSFPCDNFVILHLQYGIKPQSCFTTWSSRDNIYPTSLAFSESYDVSTTYRSKVLIGEARGYFLYQDSNSYSDPKLDPLVFPSSFINKAIIYRFESSALDLGSDATKKYCVDLTAELANETNIAVQFLSRRDDGGPWGTFSEIRNDIPPSTTTNPGSGAIIWGISEYAWNDSADLLTHDWDSQSLVEGRRFFPQGTLRSTRRQIGFTNAFTFVSVSDTLGLASITVAKQVSLNSGSWPGDCEGYWIGIDPTASGTYTYYEIRSLVSVSVISVYDPSQTFPTSLPVSNFKWQMKGYRKFERANLLSYTVNFDQGSNTQNPSHGTSGLVNA